jgi:hypothetical protein
MSPTLTSLSAATRHAGTIALILPATAVTSSLAQEPQMPNPPTAVKGMKPYEVVDKVLSHKHDLLLTNNQTQNLTKLRDQLKKGEPITEPTGRGKPPYDSVVKITTPQQAYARATGYLDGKQQHQCLMLFEKEGKTGTPAQ